MIWAPGLITEPKVFDTPASEVDALATIASFAGVPYTATTLGRDLFDPQYEDKRYAFTVAHTSPMQIGLVSDKYWFRMSDDGSNANLDDISSDTPREDVSASDPKEREKMRALTEGIYKTLQYMVHHNKREEIKVLPKPLL